MSSQFEVRFAGLGGQGLILAGIILAEAAILDDKYVTQTQSYGAATRGGFSRSDVIISDEEILFPMATKLDLLLTMSQDAYEEHKECLKKDGVLIIDSTYVSSDPDHPKSYAIAFSRIAREKFGKENVANIIALGSIVKLFPIISEQSMEKAILKRVPPAFLEINKKAFKEGLKLASLALKEKKEAHLSDEYD